MNAEPAKIVIGDFCRYDGKLCELVAIDGMVAKLRREDGQLAAVKIADLFADEATRALAARLYAADFDALGYDLDPRHREAVRPARI